MTSPSNIPPLPLEHDFSVAIARTDLEFQQNDGPLTYLRHYFSDRRNFPVKDAFFDMVGYVGVPLEPINTTTGEFLDPKHRKYEAYFRGAVIGRSVVTHLSHGFIQPDRIFDAFSPEAPVTFEEKVASRERRAADLVSMGQHGMMLLGEAGESIIKEWEERIVDGTEQRGLFRVGLGFVALSAYRSHAGKIQEHKMELALMQDSLIKIDEFDWDAAASEFLDRP